MDFIILILLRRWTRIAPVLDRRTDHGIKNYWNTHLKKNLKEKLIQLGIDPIILHNATNGPFVGNPLQFPDLNSMRSFLMEELSPSSSLPNTGGRVIDHFDFKSDVRRLQANNVVQLAQVYQQVYPDRAAQFAQVYQDPAVPMPTTSLAEEGGRDLSV